VLYLHFRILALGEQFSRIQFVCMSVCYEPLLRKKVCRFKCKSAFVRNFLSFVGPSFLVSLAY
ncbi:hypothetical protein IFM89_031797, partial [Coptis chinensis]